MGLKILHTADWHLGARFVSFERDARLELMRARLDVIDRILGLAERHEVDAVLCAGDLFDDMEPEPAWWRGLSEKLNERAWEERPVFLLPGNHDPLTAGSVYSSRHPFRQSLPPWVHVVDRDDFCFELSADAVLYAVPCRSRSEGRDLAQDLLPAREAGDERLRIGMVHGQTFDIPGCQQNFPIGRNVARDKGLDYLAVGDTHGFRDVTPGEHAPTIYPGAPEPTEYGEKDAGNVALVYFPKDRGSRAVVRKERVARWSWRELEVKSLSELRELALRDEASSVVRLRLDLSVAASEMAELERLLVVLEGSEAAHGRVGVLEVDRERLQLDTTDIEEHFQNAPPMLQAAAARLRALQKEHGADSREGKVAARALYRLLRLAHEVGS